MAGVAAALTADVPVALLASLQGCWPCTSRQQDIAEAPNMCDGGFVLMRATSHILATLCSDAHHVAGQLKSQA
jgi:hypothetical protein